jgi:hypothetical protein
MYSSTKGTMPASVPPVTHFNCWRSTPDGARWKLRRKTAAASRNHAPR